MGDWADDGMDEMVAEDRVPEEQKGKKKSECLICGSDEECGCDWED